ncbi:MAG: LuxR family transcriptional regulator [Chloroflexota bacterium]|nr:MAG: LuxR family transcriptional regulator [Chloroflexota bacterium]
MEEGPDDAEAPHARPSARPRLRQRAERVTGGTGVDSGRPGLTLSEARVARLVAEGRSDAEIAERLAITVIDVDAELAAVFRKLGLRSRTELSLLVPPPTRERPRRPHRGDGRGVR